MRNLILAINTTLDGCVDHTKQVADEETHEYFTHLMRDVDLLVFAQAFDSIDKIVFSRSLGSAENRNTRIVRTNLPDEILKLKQQQGKKNFGRW